MGKGDGQGEGSGAGKGGEITVTISKKPEPVIVTSAVVTAVGSTVGSKVVLVPTGKPKKKRWVVRVVPLRELVERYRPKTALERYICTILFFIAIAMILIGGLLLAISYGLIPFSRLSTSNVGDEHGTNADINAQKIGTTMRKPAPKLKSDLESKLKSDLESKLKSDPSENMESKPEPESKLKSKPKSKQSLKTDPESKLKPESEPESESKLEPTDISLEHGHKDMNQEKPSTPTLIFSKKTHQAQVLPRVRPETWEADTQAPTQKVKLGPTIVSPCKCVHRRMATAPIEGMSSKREAQEIIHDTKARWTALVDGNLKRCLLFNPMTSDISTCPQQYPWLMDRHIGALPCTWGPQAVPGGVLHYTSKVVRLVLNAPMTEREVNKSGSAIVKKCAGFDSFRVIAVYVSYYSQLRRTRSAGKLTEILMDKVDDAFDEAEKALATIDLNKMSVAAATALKKYGNEAEKFLFGDHTQSMAAMSDVLVETVSMAMNKAGVDLKDIDKVIVQE